MVPTDGKAGLPTMLCSELTLVNEIPGEARVMPLLCRCWTCDNCRPMRKARLVAECLEGTPNTFITLTANPKTGNSPEHRARLLVRAWREVRRQTIRKYGYKKLPFMAVFEATKNGEPHLHILARSKWIDQKWLSNTMHFLMDSPIVDIRRIKDPNKMANYVAKYVGKDPHHFKGTKRYWRSLDYLLTLPPEDARRPGYNVWLVERHTIEQTVDMYKFWGFTHIERDGDMWILKKPPP